MSNRSDSTNEPIQPCDPSAGDLAYLDLDAETRAIVQQCTSKIKSLTKRNSKDIVEIGEYILVVKRRLKHGKFCEWLENEFDWSDFSARQFMNVAKCFKSEKFSDLKIEPSALYLLARPSTDHEVRQEALQRASRGEKITHRKALKIIDHYVNPPIAPEVLLPDQRIASPQKQARPSVVIRVKPSAAALENSESLESVAEARGIEDGTLPCLPPASENIIEFRPSLIELKPETSKNVFSECKTEARVERASTSVSPIRVLNVEVDAALLQGNPLQVIEISSEGFSLRLEARAGDFISWIHSQIA